MDNWHLGIWDHRIKPRLFAFSRKKTKRNDIQSANEEGGEISDEEGKVSKAEHKRHRIGHSLAAAAMLPAIFVQVPGGLAVSGSLFSGIMSADQIVQNATGTTVVSSASVTGAGGMINSTAFIVGYSVIQVAIGITVGLFLAALAIYPLGKRRSGLFSF
jgi:hypothetical protein